MTTRSSHNPPAVALRGRDVLLVGLLAALLGLLLGASDLAGQLHRELTAFDQQWRGAHPLPQGTYRTMRWLAQFASVYAERRPIYAGVGVVLAGLVWLAFRGLNPAFSLWLPPAAPASPRLRLRPAWTAIVKALLLAGVTIAVGMLLLLLYGRLGHKLSAALGLSAAFGACTWLLWSHCGWAGDGRSLSWSPEASRRSAAHLAVHGALAGLLAALIARPHTPDFYAPVFAFLHGFGDFVPGPWRAFVVADLALYAVRFFFAGSLVYALTPAHLGPGRRLGSVAPSIILAGLPIALALVLLPQIARQRLDYGLEQAPPQALSQRLRLGDQRMPVGTVLVLQDPAHGPFGLGIAVCQAPSGLAATEATLAAERRFLRTRGYRTAMARLLATDIAAILASRWQTDERLAFARELLAAAPTMAQVVAAEDALARCAASSEARHAALFLADPDRFRLPSADVRRSLARTLARLGEIERASQLVQEEAAAPEEMPALPPRPLLGEVTGTIHVDGAPAAGVRVGLLPYWQRWRLSGLLDSADHAAVGIATTTDSRGHFRLTRVPRTRGGYALAIMADANLIPGDRGRIAVAGAPGRIRIRRGAGPVDVGVIHITVEPFVPSPEQSA